MSNGTPGSALAGLAPIFEHCCLDAMQGLDFGRKEFKGAAAVTSLDPRCCLAQFFDTGCGRRIFQAVGHGGDLQNVAPRQGSVQFD